MRPSRRESGCALGSGFVPYRSTAVGGVGLRAGSGAGGVVGVGCGGGTSGGGEGLGSSGMEVLAVTSNMPVINAESIAKFRRRSADQLRVSGKREVCLSR
jgi:hypothetical protein